VTNEDFPPLDTDELLNELRALKGRSVIVRVDLLDSDQGPWMPVAWIGGVLLAVNPSPLDAPPGADIVAWDVWVGDPEDARDLMKRMTWLSGFQVTPRRVVKAGALPGGYGVTFQTKNVGISVEATGDSGSGS
jgi:hypothetical protein